MLAYGHPSDPSRAPVHHLVRPCGVRVSLRDHVTSVISSSRRPTLARVRSERVFARPRMIHEVVRDHRARLVRVQVIIDQLLASQHSAAIVSSSSPTREPAHAYPPKRRLHTCSGARSWEPPRKRCARALAISATTSTVSIIFAAIASPQAK